MKLWSTPVPSTFARAMFPKIPWTSDSDQKRCRPSVAMPCTPGKSPWATRMNAGSTPVPSRFARPIVLRSLSAQYTWSLSTATPATEDLSESSAMNPPAPLPSRLARPITFDTAQKT